MLGLARYVTHGGSGPSLNYNFVDGGAFPSAITFSRGSNATQFDSSGNLVYAPANLLVQSEAFNTTWTTSNASITANSTAAPNGATTADTLVEDTATNFHYVQQTVSSTTNANSYTFSCFIKASTRTAARIAIIEGTTFSRQVRATADLSAGTVVGAALNSATLTAATIDSVGNNWYRVTVTGVLGGTDTNIACFVYVGQSTATFNYTGDGTSGVFIWGAQLNLSPIVGGITGSLSTYYPTTASAYYGPRLDYDPATLLARGFLVEEARTNSIRNNTMQGATAGAPGVFPTNWSASLSGSGVTQEIAAVGTENGIAYVDVRYYGTPSAGTNVAIGFEGPNQIVAASGQTWTESVFLKLQAGSFNNTSTTLSLLGTDGVNGTESITSSVITSTPSNLRECRLSTAGTFANALTTRAQPRIRIGYTVGVAFDITLRIGLPQLEQGAFATSAIPTTTTALTRNADVASVNTLAPWYNATEGTLYTEVTAPQVFSSFPPQAMFHDGTASNYLLNNFGSGGAPRFERAAGGVTAGTMNASPVVTAGSLVKQASAFKLNDFALVANGGTPVTSASGNMPTVTTLRLGGYINAITAGNLLNGYLRRISYFPRRLPDATLQQITA